MQSSKKAMAVVIILLTFVSGIFIGRYTVLKDGGVITNNQNISGELEALVVTQGESQTQVDLRININTATKQQFMELSGIGEAIAERIVNYRQTYGEFKSVEELMSVSGIGEGTLSRLRPYIKVG